MPLDKTLGYEYIYDPDHPLANKSGKVYVHRIIASEKLGRWIKSEEHVHHIDGNKINNNPNNIQIVTQSEHALLEMLKNGFSKRIKISCKKCGKELCSTKKESLTEMCFKCSQQLRRLFDPSREELLKLVWEMPTVKVARIFGVSDKAIEKRCRKLGIKKPPRGYWQKKGII